MFDVLVDELRTHSTEWLESRRCRAGDREERAGALVEGTTRGAVARREVSGHLCGRRRGLEVHHLVPRSWHGTADISNLAAVCPAHTNC